MNEYERYQLIERRKRIVLAVIGWIVLSAAVVVAVIIGIGLLVVLFG